MSDIDLLYTTLRTFDRKQVFLPNSSVASTTIKNYSREDIIRIEIEV
ncbi:mechanosensitive ion channel [bacterium]|nr:mechanosensitive ion channel [bacterium]